MGTFSRFSPLKWHSCVQDLQPHTPLSNPQNWVSGNSCAGLKVMRCGLWCIWQMHLQLGGSTVGCTSFRSDGVARPAVTIDENDVGISG